MVSDVDVPTSIARVKEYLLDLQQRICSAIEREDQQQQFLEDRWQHPQGGGGITCVLSHGAVIEKGGVNFSHVYGEHLPKAATEKRPDLTQANFQALGVSVVIHPLNPYVPTSHFNVRFILVEKPEGVAWWFGGGFDLTPYYGFDEDCVHWHQMAKAACDVLDEKAYEKYKKWCDQYFFLVHRQEPRGIGGIFFDDLNEGGFEKCFKFAQAIGDYYIQAYQPIVAQRKNLAFGERERNFQLYRRGRYVEFNLLYDRGTLFGLQSRGRTESILISLPPLVSWEYHRPIFSGSPESELYDHFLKVREW